MIRNSKLKGQDNSSRKTTFNSEGGVRPSFTVGSWPQGGLDWILGTPVSSVSEATDTARW